MTRERELIKKRGLIIGRIRPNIILYKKENFNTLEINKSTRVDLRRRPNIIFIINISLRVFNIKIITKELYRLT